MDLHEVTHLIQSYQIRDLRNLLFDPVHASTRSHYLSFDLLKNLPTILSKPDHDSHDQHDGDRRDMAYTIIEFERRNRHPDDFTKILHEAILTAAQETVDPLLVEVMIHSGGNFFYTITEDVTCSNLFDHISPIHQMQEVIDKYFPGIWNAVETGNMDDLRRLINCWCNIDIHYKGESLIQLAHRVGHESVIRLVTGAHHTLQLIHSFLGGNVPAIRELLNEHPAPVSFLSEYGINLDFKHLSDQGAPLIYYVIIRNEIEIARLLVSKGCKIYTLMPCPDEGKVFLKADAKNAEEENETTESGKAVTAPKQQQQLQMQQQQDVPVFYAALTNPDLDPDMMSALLSFCEQDPERMHDLLYRMMFRGMNCIELAMHAGLNIPAFAILISRAGAKAIADRNPSRETPRDVAVRIGRQDYADIIDNMVKEFIQSPDRHEHQRQILALFGYDLTDLVMHETPVDSFYSLFPEYQSQISRLAQAIVNDDFDSFQSLAWWIKEDELSTGSTCTSTTTTSTTATASAATAPGNEESEAIAAAGSIDSSNSISGNPSDCPPTASPAAVSVLMVGNQDSLFERLLIWDGREGEINPLPLLHRAVIHGRVTFVEFILNLKPIGQSIDCLFDHYRRTALHYAESSKDWEEIRSLLRIHGASDHTLDRVRE